MPKRKRVQDYGNKWSEEIREKYINTWTNNSENGLIMASMFLEAEGGSLLQLIICDDEEYNGIFHIKCFEFNLDSESLIIDDLDILHNLKNQTQKGLMKQINEIARKYQGKIPKNIDLTINPLENIDNFIKVILE